MEKLVYIILINYNSKVHTIECLESLSELNYINYRIIIVDNNSIDNDFDKVKSKYNNVYIINNKKNYGFAGANNIGIKYALDNKADYILLLNNDTTVDKDFLSVLVNESEKNKKVAICTSKILYYGSKNKIWYGGGGISYFKGNSQIYNLNCDNDSINNKNMYCNFASGCCMLINSEALKKVGLMNEEYFLYYEDVDYCIKFLNAGYKIYYVPESIIFHKESISTKKYSYLYQYYFARNRLLFIKKNFNMLNKITAYPISILWLLYKILNRTFNFKPCIEGIKDFLIHNYGMKEEG